MLKPHGRCFEHHSGVSVTFILLLHGFDLDRWHQGWLRRAARRILNWTSRLGLLHKAISICLESALGFEVRIVISGGTWLNLHFVCPGADLVVKLDLQRLFLRVLLPMHRQEETLRWKWLWFANLKRAALRLESVTIK